MRRDTIQVGDSFLTTTPKLFIVSRQEYVLMICKQCGLLKSSYVFDAKMDRNTYELIASRLNRLPKCLCKEWMYGTNSDKRDTNSIL
jgi:predicted nucleic-acid-binding Zn-ribbon protein